MKFYQYKSSIIEIQQASMHIGIETVKTYLIDKADQVYVSLFRETVLDIL